MSLLIGLFSANLMAQTYTITDQITYDEDCDITNTVVATNSFNFEIDFDATMQNNNLYHQFSRQVSAVFSDANGNVLKTVDLGWNNIVDATYDIYETDLSGLPSGEIHVDIVVTYNHNINNPYINPLSVFDNGSSACSIVFQNTTQELVCTLEDVLCFDFEACDDVTVGLYTKLGYMRSNVSPSGGNYAYQWYVDPDVGPSYFAGTADRVKIASGCATYYLTVTDLDTGCKYRANKRGCAIDIQIDECLIGIPSGLQFAGVNIFGGYILDWNDTPGAGSYSVVLTLNDEACCSNGKEEKIITINNLSQSTYIYYPKSIFVSPCFSWKVIAHCPKGSGSSMSESTCLFGFQAEEEFETRSISSQEISVFPNPAIEVINIEANHFDSTNADLLIMDSQGKVIFNTTINVEANQLQYSWNIPEGTAPGVYFIQIRDKSTVFTKKFLHIK